MTFGARMSRWTASLVRRAGEGMTRFPVAVVAIAGFSVVSNLAVAGRIGDDEPLVRLLAALSGAGAVSVATSLFLEGRGASGTYRVLVSGLAAIGVGAAIGWAEPLSIYAPALLIASLAAVPLAPFVGRGSPRAFWTFALWSSVGFVLSFATVLLFCLGAQAVLEMVRYLFRVSLVDRLDRHLYTVATTLVGPLFALGRIPHLGGGPVQFDENDRLVAAVRQLFEWVQAPLVLATAAVLHVYVARIVLTGEVPRNEIGWIVSIYALMLISLRFALDPFRGILAPHARMALRSWIGLLTVPLSLLTFAVARRVGSEGVTAERYYLALWCLSLTVSIVLQAHPRLRSDIRVLLAVPVLLLALSTLGPWGVSASVGRSQIDRIREEFPAFLTATPSAPIVLTVADAAGLQSRLRALGDVDGLDQLRSVLAPQASHDPVWLARRPDPAALQASLTVAKGSDAERPVRSRAYRGASGPLNLMGYDQALLALSVDDLNSAGPVGLIANGTSLAIRYAGRDDLLDLPVDLFRKLDEASLLPSDRAPTDIDLRTQANRTIRLRIESLAWDTAVGDESAVSVRLLTAVVLLRSAEWTP